MYPITKEEMKNLRHVLSDPDVSEERWLAACEMLGGRDIVGRRSAGRMEAPVWREKTGLARMFSTAGLVISSLANSLPLVIFFCLLNCSFYIPGTLSLLPDLCFLVLAGVGGISLLSANLFIQNLQNSCFRSSSFELLLLRAGIGLDLANLAQCMMLCTIGIFAMGRMYPSPPIELPWFYLSIAGFVLTFMPALTTFHPMKLQNTWSNALSCFLLCLPQFVSLISLGLCAVFVTFAAQLFFCASFPLGSFLLYCQDFIGKMTLLFTGYVAGIFLPSWYFAWRNRRAWRRFIEGE